MIFIGIDDLLRMTDVVYTNKCGGLRQLSFISHGLDG